MHAEALLAGAQGLWTSGTVGVAGLVLLAAGLFAALSQWAAHATPRLADAVPPEPATWPSVSLIVAARNEAAHVAEALQSLLALDYPAVSITVVNDRSTDATVAILDRYAACAPQLTVLHVHELPPGWLGKNHALDLAARRAAGQWLLFTDADVFLEPSALKRAMAHALAQRLDHLAVAPRPQLAGWLLGSLVAAFSLYFSLWIRAWAIRWPSSTAHVGIGAFNLVRAEAYRAVGGHAAIRLRPDDDLKLGKLLKQAGYAQGLASGVGLVAVPWYESVGAMVRGLEKNAFAGVEYRPHAVLAASLAVLILHVWPFLAVGVTAGAAWWMYVAACSILGTTAACAACGIGLSWWHGLGFPLAALLLVVIQWRSMLLNYYHGGIRWRDTFYPLAELRANRV
jgi:hypothetical protein